MYVGYMRNVRNPRKFVNLLAKTTKYYGIDLVYFHPEDIDFNKKVIHGKVLINNKWVSKVVAVPSYVDLNVYSFKYKNAIKFLRQHSYFSTGRLGTKSIIYKKLKNDGEFNHILIPTINCTDFKSMYNFLNKYKSIVIKPTNGQKGQGVYRLIKQKYNYILTYQNTETKLSKRALKKLFKRTFTHKNYIIQKYIESTTKFGDPFDCRIRLEKNGKGKWEVVTYLVRIGSGQKVVSNISQGGSISSLDSFLKNNYYDNWKDIKKSIKQIGKTLPYKIEEVYDQQVQSLGIDIGIDKKGNIFFFEANNAPGVEGAWGEIAMVKSDYYNYILKKIQQE